MTADANADTTVSWIANPSSKSCGISVAERVMRAPCWRAATSRAAMLLRRSLGMKSPRCLHGAAPVGAAPPISHAGTPSRSQNRPPRRPPKRASRGGLASSARCQSNCRWTGIGSKEDGMRRLCEGRVAIVTGAGRGLGRQHALLLAAHGAKVVVNDVGAGLDGSGTDASPAREVANAIKDAGGEAIIDAHDVSDWRGAKAMIEHSVDSFGKLDILINNAGILRDRMLTNMEEEEWDAVIKVHLKGTFAPSRHAASYWRDESKRSNGAVTGRIITTTSTSGIFG